MFSLSIFGYISKVDENVEEVVRLAKEVFVLPDAYR